MTEPSPPTEPAQQPDAAADTQADPRATQQKVSRHSVLKRLTNLYSPSRYLEVGVSKGYTFDRVPADRKVAVDPQFRFDHEAAALEHPEAAYHQVTSDEYFASIAGREDQFDVIYLDGLHVVEQTLRDLMNALEHLQPRGVIVIDDTRPPSHLASLPGREDFFAVREWLGTPDLRWMGDIYRLVWFVDTFCPGLTYRTIENNHGQTVLWRQPRTATPRSLREVADLGFDQMVLEESVLRRSRFGDIRRELRRDLGL